MITKPYTTVTRLFACLLVLASFAASPAAGQGICLEPATSWPVASAIGVNTGDIDGDGLPDVLLGGGTQASWSRNLGQGSFDAPVPLVIPPWSQSHAELKVADFDGDGDADVAYATRIRVGICENLGGGALAIGVNLASNNAVWASDMEVADLDFDGDLDIAYTWSEAYTGAMSQLMWLENLGALSFGPPQVLHTSTPSFGSTHAVDFDGDEDPDLFVMRPEGLLAFQNLGGGAFAAPLILESTSGTDVTSADLDGDGDQDLLAFHAGAVGLTWYENLGGFSWPGVFGAGQSIATIGAVVKVKAADLDGDGDQDLVSTVTNGVVTYENLGGAVFGAGKIQTAASNGQRLALDDMDADGFLDVLYADHAAAKVELLRNTTLGARIAFSQPVPGGLDISVTCGPPSDYYFSAFTLNGANANGGLGSGWWGGLHISFHEFTALLNLAPVAPYQGYLDGNGSAFFSVPSGFAAAAGLTVYANVTTFDLAQASMTSQSTPVAYTFQ